MVNKSKKLGGRNNFGRLVFKDNYNNNSNVRNRSRFDLFDADNLLRKMEKRNENKYSKIISNLNSKKKSKTIVPDYNDNINLNNTTNLVKELKNNYNDKYAIPTNLNLVNREILMASSLNDLEKILSPSNKRKFKNIIDSILKKQKKVVKVMYKTKKIDRNNYNAIKYFIK